MPTSYESAAAKLRGKRLQKKIGHNTVLRKDGDDYVVRYYETDIVRYCADGDVIFDWTWRSATTRERMKCAHMLVWFVQRNYRIMVCTQGMMFALPDDPYVVGEAWLDLEPVE